jgi:DNA-binding MarR family transcriptional regulator
MSPARDPAEEPGEAAGLPPALSDRLGVLLGRAHLAHRRIAEAELAALGLRPKEFGALSVLAAEGPLSQQRLGERMGVDRTTMVAVCDALEDKGLVERERSPEDRRAYALSTTGEGRRALARATRAAERAEARSLAGIPEADRRRLKELLRELAARGSGTSSG